LIRFGYVASRSIGHLALCIDNYLSNKNKRGFNEIAIFLVDKSCSNSFLYSLWKKNKKIIFTEFLSCPYIFLKYYFSNSSLLISWHNELYPVFSIATLSPSNITMGDLKSQKILKRNKVNPPYICLHNRDSAYYEKNNIDDNYHNFRDFDFDDFELGIERITASGVSAVRIGKEIKKEYKSSNSHFISMTESKSSDFLDIVLVEKSLFLVSCKSGLAHTSSIFRKRQLLINYIPFMLNELSVWAANSIILPKKIYKIDENRYLRIAEMACLPYDIHYKGDFFVDNGLRVENNSQEEIADAMMEMLMRVTDRWKDSTIQNQLQNRFFASVCSIEYSDEIFNKLRIAISSTFLERNPFLI